MAGRGKESPGLLDAVIAGNGVMFSDLDLEAWVTLAHQHGKFAG